MINWPQFLTSKGIHYVMSGPNTARNNISIKCPYCTDPSEHLGISLEGKGWSCWRCHNHGGATKLIQKLLHCDWEEAQRIAGVKTIITVSDATFKSYVRGMMTKEAPKQNQRTLKFPPEITTARLAHQILYLKNKRNYTTEEAHDIIRLYTPRLSLAGPFQYRFIFPIYDKDKNLLTWTGRAIGNSTLRYKDLSENPEKAKAEGLPQALKSIKKCLWNYHELAHTHYDKLIICEGPFDCLKLDYYGRSRNVRSTCLFGKRISDEQISLLGGLRPLCNSLYITLDADSATDMARIVAQLAHLNCEVKRLPKGIADPANMTKEQIEEWL